MKTFHCEFLGCKVNQYDAAQARRALLQHGFQEAEERADFLLLASCTVTATASRKGRQAVRGLLRRHPGAPVAVLGCMTEADRRFYTTLPAEVTVLPSARDDGFLAALAPLLERGARGEAVPQRRRTRAWIKIEDGCDLSCSFCIIPSVRGRARSRPPQELEAELAERVAEGVPEIVLTGVHLGHYGRRTPFRLADLLRRLARVPGPHRLRLSSLEVSELSEEILAVLAEEERFVPHLHLPLQSGSSRVLRRMRRPYGPERFRSAVERVQELLEEPALTTDVIVGFPGESDTDFEATLELCRSAGFSRIHVFPFSARPGTHAFDLPGRVPQEEIATRKKRLFALERELRAAALERRRGRQVRVVVEDVDAAGRRIGYDERYHRTRLEGSRAQPGELVVGTVESVADGMLVASAADGP